MKVYKSKWVLGFILLCWANVSYAIFFIDVYKVNYSTTGIIPKYHPEPFGTAYHKEPIDITYIRAVKFNVDEQSYESINYLYNPGEEFEEDSVIDPTDSKTEKIQIDGISIFYDGTVNIPKTCDINKYIVRTFKHNGILIDNAQLDEKQVISENGTDILIPKKHSKSRSIEDLRTFFNQKKFINKRDKKDIDNDKKLITSYCSGITGSNTYSIDSYDHDNEKNLLAELAADLTMTSYGYNKHKSRSQDREDDSNAHGFDGIFKARDNSALFISEGKRIGRSANHALEELISTFDTKMSNLKIESIESYETINKYSLDSTVYLLGYRLYSDGKFQIALKKYETQLIDNIIRGIKMLSTDGLARIMKTIQTEISARQPSDSSDSDS